MAYEDYRFVGIRRNQGVVFVTVDELAYRIASFPAEAVACVKKAIQGGAELDIVSGLFEETTLFLQTMRTESAR